MGKNKNNQPIWNTRIKKEQTNLFKKVGGSIAIDKRLFREDIEASIVHVEMLFRQKIINFNRKARKNREISNGTRLLAHRSRSLRSRSLAHREKIAKFRAKIAKKIAKNRPKTRHM